MVKAMTFYVMIIVNIYHLYLVSWASEWRFGDTCTKSMDIESLSVVSYTYN